MYMGKHQIFSRIIDKNYRKAILPTIIVLLLISFFILISLYIKSINEEIQNDNLTEIPVWINNLIEEEKSNPVANPPASITRCIYKNQVVYYIPPRCCDIPSKLYNEEGDIMCSPDGGFTGKGNGKCNDFSEKRTNCKIIWEDTRIL